MHLSRMRSGEWLALVSAVALLVVLFLDWYETDVPVPGAHHTGWASVGWFAAGVTALAIAVCLGWLAVTVTQVSPALPVGLDVLTVFLGIIASLSLLLRLVLQPGLGVGLGNAEVDLLAWAYVGPLLAVAMTAGAWRALADERTEAASSQPGDIELRPIPE